MRSEPESTATWLTDLPDELSEEVWSMTVLPIIKITDSYGDLKIRENVSWSPRKAGTQCICYDDAGWPYRETSAFALVFSLSQE